MIAHRSFIAWQPVLTDHQAFTLAAVSRLARAPVIAYVLQLEHNVRQAQGWTDTQVKSIERRLLPPKHTLRHCFRQLQAHRDDIHLFCSPFEQPKLVLTLLMAALLRVDFYLISEPYSPQTEGYFDDADGAVERLKARLKARLRPWVYRCYGALIGRQASGVFAISELAVLQYRRIGVCTTKIFPFGYFVPGEPSQAGRPQARTAAAGALSLVFVGSLIRRKGLDWLVAAVHRLLGEGFAVALDVYGPGDPAPYFFDEIKVRYRGVIPFGQAQSVIAGHDLLVLPSRFDGWGVVVNEALCAGVPVMCSDRVGARTLIEKFGAGKVFEAEVPNSLYEAIKALLQNPALYQHMRRATGVAKLAIDPVEAGRYMLAVVDAAPHDRPQIPSPWYRQAVNSHA